MPFSENDLIVAEQLRAERVRTNAAEEAKELKDIQHTIDGVIRALQLNRDHIGGIAMVVLPKFGSAIVRPEATEASDGIRLRQGLDETYSRLLATHMQDLMRPANPFAALMGE